MTPKKRMLVAIAMGMIASVAVTAAVVLSAMGNMASASQRKQSDFIAASFQIGEIWELQKKQRDSVKESYIFIKPQGEDFKLRFPESDFFGRQENKQHILSRLQVGDPITVKVLKSRLEAVRRGGILMWLVRFVQGEKREVTIYQLKTYDEVVTDYPINGYDAVDRDFIDRWTRMAVIFGLLLVAIVMSVKKLRRPGGSGRRQLMPSG